MNNDQSCVLLLPFVLHRWKKNLFTFINSYYTTWYAVLILDDTAAYIFSMLVFSFCSVFDAFSILSTNCNFFRLLLHCSNEKKNVILFWFLLLLLVEWMHAFNSNVITNIFVIQLLCKMFEWTSSGLILLFCISMEIDFTLECNLCINFKWKKQ